MTCRTRDPKDVASGRLFILSAPSGAGKTTLCKAIRAHFGDLHYSVSYTTRKPREGELQGKDYHFIDEAKFEMMIAMDQWAEWAKVHGNYYGTSAEDIDKSLMASKDVLLDIDVQGAAQLLKRYPESVSIFILAPSMDELKSRLEKRGTDSPDTIRRRLDEAKREIRRKDHYRHIVVNDRLEDTINALTGILMNYRCQQSPST